MVVVMNLRTRSSGISLLRRAPRSQGLFFLALKSVEIRGKIRNPVEYLVELLETDAFKANDIRVLYIY